MDTVIVGAGISGLALAILLARQGHQVSVYDKRIAFDAQTDGRSINFTVSGRGLSVLKQLGLAETVRAHSAVLVGRILHLPKQKTLRYKYGTKQSQVLLSIRRSTLITILLKAAALEENIHIHSGFELIDIDEKTVTSHFLDLRSQNNVMKKSDIIVGADGVFSQVRSLMLKKQISGIQQTVFTWGYKEYQFDQFDAKKLNLCANHMHMWPKQNALLVSIPNTDYSHSVIFTAPRLNDRGETQHFDDLVQREFPDIVAAAPSFLSKITQCPHNYLISIKTDKWHLSDTIVLIGDACHATYPFYGQGMNSALEDAVFLSNYINDKASHTLHALMAYEKKRKQDTNALHRLSEGHLHHMTKAMTSIFWQACNVLDFQLSKFFPKKWVYEYEIVSHSTMSYHSILDMVKKQNNKKVASGFFVIASLLCAFMKIKNTCFSLLVK